MRALLDLDDDELSRLDRCEPDDDVHDAVVDVVLRRRVLAAPDEVRAARRGAWKAPCLNRSCIASEPRDARRTRPR
jgi:hypothetical protein